MTSLPPRRRGRPPAFERATVLDRATTAFWERGYEGASIADLTAAMGISAQSLYTAFGSKSALFREVLDHYRRTVGAFAAEALDEEASAMAGIERLLRESAEAFCRPRRPRGCMIATAVLACAVENRDEARHVAALRRASVKACRQRIERAVVEGEFRPGTNAAALARYVGSIVQGLSVQARDGAARRELLEVAELAIGTLRAAVAREGLHR